MNFRPYEEFYDLSKLEREEKLKKSTMYRTEIFQDNKMQATESTTNPQSPLDFPRKGEYSPSPMKVPAQENAYKFDYSSMIAKAQGSTQNFSQADIVTNRETEKENLPEVELVRPINVVTNNQNSKPYANQAQIKDSEYRLRISEFDRLY